ncbi:MAG TPA: hypothetical protein VHV81_12695 [Steroidobacteraceae bacterium]|nr:hypothetical protein [Steroidobacteraceae bacterium]
MRDGHGHSARWVETGGSWRLEAEIFATLTCMGTVDCEREG